MVSAQRSGGASVIAFSGIDVTPTPTPTNEEAVNGRRQIHEAGIQRTETKQYIYIRFDGRPVIFNTHTILLTKSISSLSNLKSNNYKKSDTRIKKRKTVTTTMTMMMMMMMTQQQQQQQQQRQ